MNYNIAIFKVINQLAGQSIYLDAFFAFVTSYLTYAVLIGVGIYVVFYNPLKKIKLDTYIAALRRAKEFVLVVFFTWLITQIIKVMFAVPRPFLVLSDVYTLFPEQGGYSFPSRHAAMTVAIATTVYIYNKRLGWFLYVFATIVALSRIYVGVHYPIDVVAGAVLGWGIAYILHRVTTHVEVADQSKTS